MTRKPNEYKNPEILQIGTAQDFILGEKVIPFLDLLLDWPLWYRTDTFGLYDEDESPD
jgi:hypothetical protein